MFRMLIKVYSWELTSLSLIHYLHREATSIIHDSLSNPGNTPLNSVTVIKDQEYNQVQGIR